LQLGTATAKEAQSRADQLEERLIDFAVRIVKLSARLPKTAAGRHIAAQILRSGTSPAPNYGEARGGESAADFVHKLRIVLKELNETSIWLRVIERSELMKSELIAGIVAENAELCKIFTASLKTVRGRNK
jgi:four helix bundle protein